MNLGSIAGLALADYLPGSNQLVKSTVGFMIGGSVDKGLSTASAKTAELLKRVWPREYSVTISKEDNNPIFEKLERHVMLKHLEQVQACPLKPMNGEIVLGLKEAEFKNSLTEEYQGHSIKLFVNTIEIKDSKKARQLEQNILVSSKTARVEILKEYIESICLFKCSSRCLRIYRAMTDVDKKGKPVNAHWNQVNVITNRRVHNTILDEKTDQDVYQDIAWFMENQAWYDRRGIPFKRGFLLHGPPGTGKTSIIKAIANEYQLDIFSIQMDNLASNSQFTLLMTQISELTGKRPYILALEDLDRANIFNRIENGVSLGTILNELDGVTETFGRILFITANSLNNFQYRHDLQALFRPGRVDKQVEIGYCTKRQLEKMVEYFSGTQVALSNTANLKDVSPASVIATIQKYAGEADAEHLLQDIRNLEFWQTVREQSAETLHRKSRQPKSRLEHQIQRKRQSVKSWEHRVKQTRRGIAGLDGQVKRVEKEREGLKKLQARLAEKKKRDRKASQKKSKTDGKKVRNHVTRKITCHANHKPNHVL